MLARIELRLNYADAKNEKVKVSELANKARDSMLELGFAQNVTIMEIPRLPGHYYFRVVGDFTDVSHTVWPFLHELTRLEGVTKLSVDIDSE